MLSMDTIEQKIISGNEIPIIDLMDYFIERAYSTGASDIHMYPTLEGLRIRFRVDGMLHDACCLPQKVKTEVISRIKVLAGLRSDEHQMTQDGRFRHLFKDGGFVDVRVAIAPTYHGENAVLRLLFNNAGDFTLKSLGFNEDGQKKIIQAIKKPSGMILVTGPTGSGKTTTLYTLLKMLNSNEVAIVTIEDPIEYAIEGVEQIQANPRAGLTFATGLRTILRQDPNIIMVGEIRDPETASLAVNTALTGHLLLSTLHTNDAATTLPRLLDMKVESFLVASTISLAIGQRLVRKICENCKNKFEVSNDLAMSLSNISVAKPIEAGEIFYRGRGCGLCSQSGYLGRICINEVLMVDNAMRDAILKKASARELRGLAIKNGMATMIDDGFEKVRQGITTIEELLRVIHE